MCDVQLLLDLEAPRRILLVARPTLHVLRTHVEVAGDVEHPTNGLVQTARSQLLVVALRLHASQHDSPQAVRHPEEEGTCIEGVDRGGRLRVHESRLWRVPGELQEVAQHWLPLAFTTNIARDTHVWSCTGRDSVHDLGTRICGVQHVTSYTIP